MILMVSVQNLEEAVEADQGGADIIDVKNLQEALVGSGHPNLVKEARLKIPAEKHVSVTLGVVPNQAGTVAMAVYAAACLNATSVKVGFVNSDYDTALDILRQSKEALAGSETKLIGSLFADNALFDGLDPRLMIRLGKESNCDGILIDTLTKDGRNLFDFLTEDELKKMVFEGKELGMSTALSGHLRLDNLDELARINPDIVGVRGAVCADTDRQRSVARESVARFKHELELRETGDVKVFAGAGNGEAAEVKDGWILVDGRGMSCAGVIAKVNEMLEERRDASFLEVVLPDPLNMYDLIAWAGKGNHKILTRRENEDRTPRVLIQLASAGVQVAR